MAVNMSFESSLEPHYNGSFRLCLSPNPALDHTSLPKGLVPQPQIFRWSKRKRSPGITLLPLSLLGSLSLAPLQPQLQDQGEREVGYFGAAPLGYMLWDPSLSPSCWGSLPRTIQTCDFRLTEITRSRWERTSQDSVLLTYTYPQEQQALCALFKRWALTHLFIGNLHTEGWTSPITLNRLRKSTIWS